jgi:hypothetical protein
MTDDIQRPDDIVPASVASNQEPNAIELKLLLGKLTAEQNEARARAAYGGMTAAEAKEYEERREHITRLTERLLHAKENQAFASDRWGLCHAILASVDTL